MAVREEDEAEESIQQTKAKDMPGPIVGSAGPFSPTTTNEKTPTYCRYISPGNMSNKNKPEKQTCLQSLGFGVWLHV